MPHRQDRVQVPGEAVKAAREAIYASRFESERTKAAVALEAALPSIEAACRERFEEELLSKETIRAAGAVSSKRHHFRPYDHITKTLFEAALNATRGEDGDPDA